MISVYRLFQIIFSLIVSTFILYFLLSYAGGVGSFGESLKGVTILNNFLESSLDVYSTGISLNYTDFRLMEYAGCSLQDNPPANPSIACKDAVSKPFQVPVFYRLGDDILLDRQVLDLGWYNLYYVLALPDTHVIFNPEDNSDQYRSIIYDMVYHMPDTSLYQANVTFGFCSGDSISEEICAGGSLCDKQLFLGISISPANPCTAHMPNEDYTLVRISPSCNQASEGLCIIPSQDTGYAYAGGRSFIYKDPFDLIALLTGLSNKNILGIQDSRALYDFKNRLMMRELKTEAEILERRSSLALNNPELDDDCKTPYTNFRSALQDMAERDYDYNDLNDMHDLVNSLEEVYSLFRELEEAGCE